MKIAVVGSRTFLNYRMLCNYLQKESEIDLIVSGGAKGADTLARRYAKENNIPIKEFIPDWDLYGKSAGYRRNVDIVNEADKVYAFWDGKSAGTKHSIDITRKNGKPITIVYF